MRLSNRSPQDKLKSRTCDYIRPILLDRYILFNASETIPEAGFRDFKAHAWGAGGRGDGTEPEVHNTAGTGRYPVRRNGTSLCFAAPPRPCAMPFCTAKAHGALKNLCNIVRFGICTSENHHRKRKPEINYVSCPGNYRSFTF